MNTIDVARRCLEALEETLKAPQTFRILPINSTKYIIKGETSDTKAVATLTYVGLSHTFQVEITNKNSSKKIKQQMTFGAHANINHLKEFVSQKVSKLLEELRPKNLPDQYKSFLDHLLFKFFRGQCGRDKGVYEYPCQWKTSDTPNITFHTKTYRPRYEVITSTHLKFCKITNDVYLEFKIINADNKTNPCSVIREFLLGQRSVLSSKNLETIESFISSLKKEFIFKMYETNHILYKVPTWEEVITTEEDPASDIIL